MVEIVGKFLHWSGGCSPRTATHRSKKPGLTSERPSFRDRCGTGPRSLGGAERGASRDPLADICAGDGQDVHGGPECGHRNPRRWATCANDFRRTAVARWLKLTTPETPLETVVEETHPALSDRLATPQQLRKRRPVPRVRNMLACPVLRDGGLRDAECSRRRCKAKVP